MKDRIELEIKSINNGYLIFHKNSIIQDRQKYVKTRDELLIEITKIMRFEFGI